MSPTSPPPTRRRSTGFFARRIGGGLIVLCGVLICMTEAARALLALA